MEEEKVFTCEKCGKERKESEGAFVLGGAAFCCENCCKRPAEGQESDSNTCEFC